MLKVSRSVGNLQFDLLFFLSLQERNPGLALGWQGNRARFTGMSACTQQGSFCPRSSISGGSNASPADHSRDG